RAQHRDALQRVAGRRFEAGQGRRARETGRLRITGELARDLDDREREAARQREDLVDLIDRRRRRRSAEELGRRVAVEWLEHELVGRVPAEQARADAL